MIELGEVAGEEPDDRPGPGITRRSVRPGALAAIAVFTLLAVTGSVVPEPRGVRHLWSAPLRERDGVTLTATQAFVSRTGDERTRITAYDLAGGATSWSRELPDEVGWVQPVRNDDILLLPVSRKVVRLGLGSEQEITTEFHRETVALDARTGDVLWRATGEPQTSSGGTTMLTEHTDQGRIKSLRLVRVGDGGTIWTKNPSGVEQQAIALRDQQPDRLILVGAGGEVTVYRYADGEKITQGRIPWTVPRPDEGYYTHLNAADGYLVVNQARPEKTEQFVYRLDTMTQLWRTRATDGYAFPCGAARLCLNEGNALVARDIATGARRWAAQSSGDLFPVTDERLLTDTGFADGTPTLIDAATGRIISSGGPGSTVWNSQVGDHVLLLRPTMRPVGRTMVIRWYLRDGRQHLLGAIEWQTTQRCQTVPGFLACSRDDRLQVTAVG